MAKAKATTRPDIAAWAADGEVVRGAPLTPECQAALDEILELRRQGRCNRSTNEIQALLRDHYGFPLSASGLRDHIRRKYGTSWTAMNGSAARVEK